MDKLSCVGELVSEARETKELGIRWLEVPEFGSDVCLDVTTLKLGTAEEVSAADGEVALDGPGDCKLDGCVVNEEGKEAGELKQSDIVDGEYEVQEDTSCEYNVAT